METSSEKTAGKGSKQEEIGMDRKNKGALLKGIVWVIGMLLSHFASGQTGMQLQADTTMQKIVAAQEDSIKLKYADVLAAQLQRLAYHSYDPSKGIRYLNYKKEPRTGAEMFSWRVGLEKGGSYYHVFKVAPDKRDVFIRYLPGMPVSLPPYLFYDWVAFKSDKRYYYALIGWGETAKTNCKAVWIATFTPDGQVDFGRRLMRRGKSRSASITFEYGKEVSMMLKQDRKGKRIVFDHLSPSEPRFSDYPMFYGPDGELNALELKKGEWWFREKIK